MQTKLKTILILHPHFTIAGGAGNFVLEVGSRLADKGYKIIVCCISCNQKIVAPYRDKMEFIELGGPLSSSLKFWLLLPLFLFKVVRTCDRINPDLIFPQVFPANWWGFLYKLLRPKVKSIWMCQEPSAFIHSKTWISAIRDPLMNFLLRSLNPFLKIIDLYLAKHIDFVFANSKYGANYAARVYGYSSEKLQPLYLGANSAFMLGEKAPTFENRKFQIITICRLTKFKNVSLLIDSVYKLKKSGFEKIELKIVGRGEEEQALIEQVKTLNLTDSVRFCGALALPELVSELSSSRAFVLASIDEPFGLVVVEALACGTPAIVVDSGGPSEIVENNISGYQISAAEIANKDVNNLSKKIEALLQNEQEFNKLSKAAIQRSAIFNWDLTTDKLEAVIKALLA